MEPAFGVGGRFKQIGVWQHVHGASAQIPVAPGLAHWPQNRKARCPKKKAASMGGL
jgi:hypothetical protein